jgi:hypothetical protein
MCDSNNAQIHDIYTTINENIYDEFVALIGICEDEKRKNATTPIISRISCSDKLHARINDHPTSPLTAVAFMFRPKMLEYLLSIKGLNVNHIDSDESCSPLVTVIRELYDDNLDNVTDGLICLRLLLQHEKVNVNIAHFASAQTPLILSAGFCSHVAVTRILLLHPRINVNLANIICVTPLMFAVMQGKASNVRQLIRQEGIDANTRNIQGTRSI